MRRCVFCSNAKKTGYLQGSRSFLRRLSFWKVDAPLLVYGLISMGVPSGTSVQISSISELVTAIQPFVQS